MKQSKNKHTLKKNHSESRLALVVAGLFLIGLIACGMMMATGVNDVTGHGYGTQRGEKADTAGVNSVQMEEQAQWQTPENEGVLMSRTGGLQIADSSIDSETTESLADQGGNWAQPAPTPNEQPVATASSNATSVQKETKSNEAVQPSATVKSTPTPAPTAKTEPTAVPTTDIELSTADVDSQPSTIEPSATPAATPSVTAEFEVAPEPSPTAEPSATTEPSETVEPTVMAEPTPTATVEPTTLPLVTPTLSTQPVMPTPTAMPMPTVEQPTVLESVQSSLNGALATLGKAIMGTASEDTNDVQPEETVVNEEENNVIPTTVVDTEDNQEVETQEVETQAITGAYTILTASLPNATVNKEYSPFALTTNAPNPADVTWRYTGELPNGMELTEDGVLTGKPTQSGMFTAIYYADFSINDVPTYATKTFTLTVADNYAPVIRKLDESIAVGQRVSYELNQGGNAPITWSISTGTVPEGIKLDSNTGCLQGVVKDPDTYKFTVKATNTVDGIENSTTQDMTLTVTGDKGESPYNLIKKLPTGYVGSNYYEILTANGTAPIEWSNPDNGLEEVGLSIVKENDQYVISGIPTKVITKEITLEAKNAFDVETRQVKLNIEAQAVVTPTGVTPTGVTPTTGTTPSSGSIKKPEILTSVMVPGYVGHDYYDFAYASGTDPMEWSVSKGALPDGLTLNSATGAISGKPTKTGTYDFTLHVKNEAGEAEQAYSVHVYDLGQSGSTTGNASGSTTTTTNPSATANGGSNNVSTGLITSSAAVPAALALGTIAIVMAGGIIIKRRH